MRSRDQLRDCTRFEKIYFFGKHPTKNISYAEICPFVSPIMQLHHVGTSRNSSCNFPFCISKPYGSSKWLAK